MFSVVQYLLILKSYLLFHTSFFIQEITFTPEVCKITRVLIFFITNEKHNLFQPLFEGRQSELEIENESCAFKVSVCSLEKFISVELTIDLKAIYTRFRSVFVCVCQDMCSYSCVCTPEHIYSQFFGCSCMIAPVFIHWLALKQQAIREENLLIHCPLTGAKARVHPHSEVYWERMRWRSETVGQL